MYKKTRTLVSLSAQQLLDCSGSSGNQGCHGGVPSNAYRYVSKKGGICSDHGYPYLGYVSLSYFFIFVLALSFYRYTTVQTVTALRLLQVDLM